MEPEHGRGSHRRAVRGTWPEEMAAPSSSGSAHEGSKDKHQRTGRSPLEEALGKLDISEEEATPLVIDDRAEGGPTKWLLAGKILHRNQFHIQTITNALRQAWGNPRGLKFRSVGPNMFVAEFESQRDRDRIWEGSPWHMNKNAIILAEFEDCMRPDEVKFDRLQVWARVLNLPYNLRDDAWSLPIAQMIDKNAQIAKFDHIGGYLRTRVAIDVHKPLRRWILIDSARRKKVDAYDIQYEQIPYFCFSCGRLGHSELYCPNPGSRDEKGEPPFGSYMRAPEDYKKQPSQESSAKSQRSETSSKPGTKNSSTNPKTDGGEEVVSPMKNPPRGLHKRKEGPTAVYVPKQLLLTSGEDNSTQKNFEGKTDEGDDEGSERGPKKKKPTPENSAEAAVQPCREQ